MDNFFRDTKCIFRQGIDDIKNTPKVSEKHPLLTFGVHIDNIWSMKEAENTQIEQIHNDIIERQTSYDITNTVAIANKMIQGTSKLTLNEQKLLRFVIMQIKPNDDKLYTYTVSIKELSKVLGLSSTTLYRDIEKMTDDIMEQVIKIGDKHTKTARWRKFHWVDVFEYDNGILTIKVSDQLIPFLIGLRECYTTFSLDSILMYRSIYAETMWELLKMGLMNKEPYNKQMTVYLPLDLIRRATNTEDKYLTIDKFKIKVLNIAVREINEKSMYHVQVRDYKEARKIVGFYFDIESEGLYQHRIRTQAKQHISNTTGQITLQDYLQDLETQEGE